jgi:hypothetical protein
LSDEIEHFAWVVLRTVNRMQAKGSTVRVIVPRDPEVVSEVAQELSLSPSNDDLLSAEEYLLECGYIEPVDIGLMRGSYSVTPAGLDWLGGSFLSPPRAPEIGAGEHERAELGPVPEALRKARSGRSRRRSHSSGPGGGGCSAGKGRRSMDTIVWKSRWVPQRPKVRLSCADRASRTSAQTTSSSQVRHLWCYA